MQWMNQAAIELPRNGRRLQSDRLRNEKKKCLPIKWTSIGNLVVCTIHHLLFEGDNFSYSDMIIFWRWKDNTYFSNNQQFVWFYCGVWGFSVVEFEALCYLITHRIGIEQVCGRLTGHSRYAWFASRLKGRRKLTKNAFLLSKMTKNIDNNSQNVSFFQSLFLFIVNLFRFRNQIDTRTFAAIFDKWVKTHTWFEHSFHT